MQIQREFSDPKLVHLLESADEQILTHYAHLVEAQSADRLSPEEERIIRERVAEADAPNRAAGISITEIKAELKTHHAN